MPSRDAPLVLVIVQRSLLQALPSPAPQVADLLRRLNQFKLDLGTQGFASRFIDASVYSGPAHRDGRILLSIRQFLISVRRNAYPGLRGVILVGGFPEATLVISSSWRQDLHAEGWNDGAVQHPEFANQSILTCWPQILAERADLVLGDLTGTWADIYHEEEQGLDAVAMFPREPIPTTWTPGTSFTFTSAAGHFVEIPQRFVDFFYIDDAAFVRMPSAPGELQITTPGARANPEVVPSARRAAGAGAHLDIAVSRIDASHVGINPRQQFGVDLLSPGGVPQAVHSATPLDLAETQMVKDANLERRLLMDYFDGNHAYRSGQCLDQDFSYSAIAYPNPGTTNAPTCAAAPVAAVLAASSPGLRPVDGLAGSAIENASILDFVRWLKLPATLRGILAHSDPERSNFGPADGLALEHAVGGTPWRWLQSGNDYTPGWGEFSASTWALHRSIWEARAISRNSAAFYLHGGCKVNSPILGAEVPYNHPRYGQWQIGESILFFLNGLAVVARAKVFNDFPDELCAALPNGQPLGDAWRAFLNAPSADKHGYDWSILGDWTLPLRSEQGWSQQQDLGGVLTSAPAACSWAANRIDVFCRGLNQHLWHWAWMGDRWSEEQDLGDVLTSAPAACSWAANRIDVFYTGVDNRVYRLAWLNAHWSKTQRMEAVATHPNGSAAQAPSEMCACSWGGTRVDIFWEGTANHMAHQALNNS